MSEVVSAGCGRPAGITQPGSLAWHLAALEAGEMHLQPDSSDWMRRFVNRCVDTLVAQQPDREFDVKLCYGMAHGFDEVPFRFFRIVRTK